MESQQDSWYDRSILSWSCSCNSPECKKLDFGHDGYRCCYFCPLYESQDDEILEGTSSTWPFVPGRLRELVGDWRLQHID